MIVEKVISNLKYTEIGCRRVDTVRMSHDQLMKPHQKVTSEGGRVVGISLPEGDHLHNGDILYLDESEAIVIDLLEEDVFELRPKTNIEWARAAFNVGNMHQRAYLYPDCIRIPYDYVMVRMLDSLGVEYSRELRKLDGLPANLPASHGRHTHGQSEHMHDHEHGHSHHHDHEHSHSCDHGHNRDHTDHHDHDHDHTNHQKHDHKNDEQEQPAHSHEDPL